MIFIIATIFNFLVSVDDQHKRCRFPEWITTHHTWVSLDHHKTFRFSQKNATLKILDDENAKPIKIHQNFAQPQFAFQDLGKMNFTVFYSFADKLLCIFQDSSRKIKRNRIQK